MTDTPPPSDPDERPPAARRGPRKPGAADVAAACLAAGQSVQEAAEKAQVGRRTVTRWLADPEFKARVDALRAEAVGRALGKLSDSMAEAAGVLRTLLTDACPHVRHKTAVKIIELAVRVREATEIEQRVA